MMTNQVLSAVLTLISIILYVYTFQMREVKSRRPFSLLMMFITIHTAGSFFEMTTEDFKTALLWENIAQTGYLLALPSLLFFVLSYAGNVRLLKLGYLLLLYLLPVLDTALCWTDRYHHWMRKDVFLTNGQLVAIGTPFAGILRAVEHTVVILAVITLIAFYKRTGTYYKKQITVMIIGILVPIMAEVFKMAWPGLLPVLPPASLTLILTGFLMYVSIPNSCIFKTLPAVKDRIMDNIPEGILISDNSGRILYKNVVINEFISDYGKGKSDSTDNNLIDFLSEWPQWVSACMGMQSAEFDFGVLPGSSEKFFHVKVYPILRHNFKKTGTVSILYNISGSKTGKTKLLSAEEYKNECLKESVQNLSLPKRQLQTIIEGITDSIHVMDSYGRVLLANESAMLFFPEISINRAGDSFAYAKYYTMDSEEISYDNSPVGRAFKGEQVKGEQMKVVYNDRISYVSVSSTPVFGKSGVVKYVVICGREITDFIEKNNIIKKQQEELQNSEAAKSKALQNRYENTEQIESLIRLNSLKDKLLLVVSHDIRLPMASMTSLLDILEDDLSYDNDDNIEIIKAVKEQVDNTCKIVENLLEWIKSQMEGLVYNPLVWDISKLIKDVITMLQNTADAKNINIIYEMERGKTVYADRDMLELVLRNLLFNAIKFTGCGGAITVYSYDSGNERVIAVKDSGIGIDGERVKTLFSEVNISSTTGTAGEKGAGLGLLICREYIARNGGRIWVDSMPGEGSTFYFSVLSAEKRKQEKRMTAD